MSAEEHLKEGNVALALEELTAAVRKSPSDPKLRVFLFQLLCVLGDWDRALTQLNVAGEMDPSALAMVQTYREALQCEVFRSRVFAGKRAPLVFGDPEEWLALLMEALRGDAEGSHERAREVRDRAFENAPATSGTVNGEPFEWIADGDQRLGPVLEAVVNGKYYWVPFHRIRNIRLDEPEDLRDMVWTPAWFTWANGGELAGLIPTRYPGSESHEEGAIRLARKTEWIEEPGGLFRGIGQRMLATDGGEFPLLDIREIQLGSAPPETAGTVDG